MCNVYAYTFTLYVCNTMKKWVMILKGRKEGLDRGQGMRELFNGILIL